MKPDWRSQAGSWSLEPSPPVAAAQTGAWRPSPVRVQPKKSEDPTEQSRKIGLILERLQRGWYPGVCILNTENYRSPVLGFTLPLSPRYCPPDIYLTIALVRNTFHMQPRQNPATTVSRNNNKLYAFEVLRRSSTQLAFTFKKNYTISQ